MSFYSMSLRHIATVTIVTCSKTRKMSYVTRLGKSLKAFYACNLWAWQAELVYFRTPHSNTNSTCVQTGLLIFKAKNVIKLSNKLYT
jgi:hypothetical protein